MMRDFQKPEPSLETQSHRSGQNQREAVNRERGIARSLGKSPKGVEVVG
jgi:hypothetical protein